MSKFKFNKNLSNSLKVLIGIPSILLVVAIYSHIKTNIETKLQSDQVIEDVNIIGHVSKLIGTLQVERGTSAVYIKSGRTSADKLNTKRALTDENIPAVLKDLDDLRLEQILVDIWVPEEYLVFYKEIFNTINAYQEKLES